MKERTYIAIDLKSFYASVECRERGLDPLDTNLVVADESRSDKTICLAVSPSLKSYGLPGRCRLFEAKEKRKEINREREKHTPPFGFAGRSFSAGKLSAHPELALDFLIAPPQMAKYMKYSADIYKIYLSFVAPEDIHVYSIDEVFIDATEYLPLYKLNAEEFARRMIRKVFSATGITATAGIGTNLYLAKIAMDIMAKHIKPDENGVRIASLDEMSYREKLWSHKPITDFWRVGRGYGKKLEENGLYTMGDVARCSEDNEELLYRLFGINAELLIDHAWGVEPCTMKAIKEYKPSSNSIGSGQVLQCPYTAEKAKLVIKEMADMLSLDLVAKHMKTNQIVLTVGYDAENIKNYNGDVKNDFYGRSVPKHAHGSENLSSYTSSSSEIIAATSRLFDRIINPALLIRRAYLTACSVLPEDRIPDRIIQRDLFDNPEETEIMEKENEEAEMRERRFQETALSIKRKFGKNSILRGLDYEDGATARERNNQIGGHKA